LSQRYGIRSFQFVDNILDMSFFKTVLPQLTEAEPKYALFYETNANLKREQVKMLAEAGVGWIQPGIESLDDNVLRLIAKGNSTLMNLQLLKWALEFGIHVSWNMLSGVPGACDSWYAEMAECLPAIFHLQPPSGVIRIRYDRFSRYHSRPQDFGLSLHPSRAYHYVYPFSKDSLMRLGYSFEDSKRPGHAHRGFQEGPGQQSLQDAVREWNSLWNSSKPQLQALDGGLRLHFLDTRPCALQQQWTAGELESEIYRLCDCAQTPTALFEQLTERAKSVTLEETKAGIETLQAAKVALHQNGKVLALAAVSTPQRGHSEC
jgi:ribosomal peptide maturation radical SAM protein 1